MSLKSARKATRNNQAVRCLRQAYLAGTVYLGLIAGIRLGSVVSMTILLGQLILLENQNLPRLLDNHILVSLNPIIHPRHPKPIALLIVLLHHPTPSVPILKAL